MSAYHSFSYLWPEVIVAVITAVPLLVFVLKELVATPEESVVTVGALKKP